MSGGGRERRHLRVGAQHFERIVVALAVLLDSLRKLPISLDVILEGLVVPSAGLDFSELILELVQADAQVLVVLLYGRLDGDIRVGHQQWGQVDFCIAAGGAIGSLVQLIG